MQDKSHMTNHMITINLWHIIVPTNLSALLSGVFGVTGDGQLTHTLHKLKHFATHKLASQDGLKESVAYA